MLTSFGKALRRARSRAGLTQEGLAEASGLDRTYVSGAERGVRNPSLVTLARLSDALDIRLSDLLTSIEVGGRR
ncbi:helix-turn-helix transcriptional regulator [Mycobacterium sp. 1165178.9]|uniref:helix-turn-helix transcriptional regulator n=1 Tax=Mycobacterium sp. 1165178.9 TaxID=1834070 RepID=UPI00350EB0F9